MPLETIHFLGLNVTYPSVVTCASSPRRLRQIRGTLLSRELYEGLMMQRLGVVSTKDSRRLLFCARGSGCTSQVRPSGMEELPGCTTTLRPVREGTTPKLDYATEPATLTSPQSPGQVKPYAFHTPLHSR